MKDIGKKLMDIARWYSMPAYHFNTIKEAAELLEKIELKPSYNSIKTELNDDAISRQAVLDGLASIAKAKAKSDAQKSMMGRTMFFVEQLPSVSTEKTGRWEWNQYDYNPNLGNWHCSECRSVVIECVDKNKKGGIPLYKYCPQCGAKMAESEDKE